MTKGELTRAYEEAVAEYLKASEALQELKAKVSTTQFNLLKKRVEGLFGAEGRAIRLSDGKEGVLVVSRTSFHIGTTPYTVKFHPITKKGVPSKSSSGYIIDCSKEGLLKSYKKA